MSLNAKHMIYWVQKSFDWNTLLDLTKTVKVLFHCTTNRTLHLKYIEYCISNCRGGWGSDISFVYKHVLQ